MAFLFYTGLWYRLESCRETIKSCRCSEEMLRRIPKCHRCPAHIPRDHVPSVIEWPREHHTTAARREGRER